MSYVTRRYVPGLPVFIALTFLLVAEPAQAQRGGCMRQQSGQSSLRTQSYSPQQSYLSQASSYALQQYALQAQLSASPQNLFLAQLNGAQLTGQAGVDVLQARLDDLQEYMADQQDNSRLTAAQLRALRQQEKTLKRLLRAAEKQVAARQQTQARATVKSQQNQ